MHHFWLDAIFWCDCCWWWWWWRRRYTSTQYYHRCWLLILVIERRRESITDHIAGLFSKAGFVSISLSSFVAHVVYPRRRRRGLLPMTFVIVHYTLCTHTHHASWSDDAAIAAIEPTFTRRRITEPSNQQQQKTRLFCFAKWQNKNWCFIVRRCIQMLLLLAGSKAAAVGDACRKGRGRKRARKNLLPGWQPGGLQPLPSAVPETGEVLEAAAAPVFSGHWGRHWWRWDCLTIVMLLLLLLSMIIVCIVVSEWVSEFGCCTYCAHLIT